MKKYLFFLSMVAVMFPAIAFSSSYSIGSILNTVVGSSDMNGMEVTIDWHLGGAETFTWDTGINESGVSLNFTGTNTSTMELEWALATNRAIDSFTINTLPGNVVFDIIATKDIPGDTPGSLKKIWGPFLDTNGWTASATSGTSGPGSTYTSPYGAEFYWEFSNPAYLSTASDFSDPAIAPHDLFSTLFIDFLDGSGIDAAFTGTFNFGVDTEKITPVPEPSSLLLLGSGLLALASARRKKTDR